jgi:3-dehydroquinate dehydratase-1
MKCILPGDGFFQIVASLSRKEQLFNPLILETDAIEIRLDLMPDLQVEDVEKSVSSYKGPVILTVRSSEEGGAFIGDPVRWRRIITPFLPFASMVDVEIRYREHASWIQELGISVIASCHLFEMPSPHMMRNLLSELSSYGDIPKLAVHPENTSDLLDLLQFTHNAPKPLIVSVTGTSCRYARPILPLFGSLWTYCYIENPTSPGQYSPEEMRTLAHSLAPGIVDTWFDSPLSQEKSKMPDDLSIDKR